MNSSVWLSNKNSSPEKHLVFYSPYQVSFVFSWCFMPLTLHFSLHKISFLSLHWCLCDYIKSEKLWFRVISSWEFKPKLITSLELEELLLNTLSLSKAGESYNRKKTSQVRESRALLMDFLDTFVSSLICKQPPFPFPVNSAKYPIQSLGRGDQGECNWY